MRSRGRGTKPLCSSSITQLSQRARILLSIPVFGGEGDMVRYMGANSKIESRISARRHLEFGA